MFILWKNSKTTPNKFIGHSLLSQDNWAKKLECNQGFTALCLVAIGALVLT